MMKIDVKSAEGITLVSLQGELGKPEAVLLEKKMFELLDAKLIRIVLDMEEIQFIDSFAIKTILRMNREAMASGGSIKLLRPRNVVKKFLTIGRVFELFDCYETKIEALNSFKKEISSKSPQPRMSHLEREGRKQKKVILRLLQILTNKGFVDIKVFMKDLNRSSQAVFQIFHEDINK